MVRQSRKITSLAGALNTENVPGFLSGECEREDESHEQYQSLHDILRVVREALNRQASENNANQHCAQNSSPRIRFSDTKDRGANQCDRNGVEEQVITRRDIALSDAGSQKHAAHRGENARDDVGEPAVKGDAYPGQARGFRVSPDRVHHATPLGASEEEPTARS